MAFVRTVSFTMPQDEADQIRPGTRSYTALVPGRKFMAQAQSGLIQTNVWRSTNRSGMVNFVIFTEWSTLEDLNAYASVPVIKEIEQALSTESNPVQIQVYEVIG
jgi:heme-degrading monooxygenase HmoA